MCLRNFSVSHFCRFAPNANFHFRQVRLCRTGTHVKNKHLYGNKAEILKESI